MATNRWLDRTQPQTLFMAVVLLYITGVFTLIFGGFGVWGLPIAIGSVAGGFGIANEKKWGYAVGIVMAVVPIFLLLRYPLANVFISLMFQIALLALLLHRQSREYQRIWFK
jgi:hypothetical protein